MKKLKVLIVEDSETDNDLLLINLRRAGYEVDSERVESAKQLKTAIAGKDWDIIISDYEMPAFNGMDAFQIVRESGLDTPFIIVSGSIGEDTAVQAMIAGVNDYLMKDNTARLAPAIERELKAAEDRRKRRESEKALAESAKRYRNLFESANDAIYTVDFDANFTSINKKGEILFDCPREEILKSNFRDFLDEPEKELIEEILDQKVRGFVGETRYELKITTKKGELKIIEVNSRVIDGDGKPTEIIGIARDITHRKKLETTLLESEKRLKLAMNSAKIGAWEWDMKGNSVSWSPECYKIMRQEKFDGQLDDFLKIVHPDDISYVWNAVNQAIKKHETFTAEYRIISSNGELVWIFDQGIVEYDNDGNPIRCIGTVRDITADKRLRQELVVSENRFRTLSENNVAGVTLGTSTGKLIFVNDAYLELIGYTREDFDNGLVNCHEVTPPEYHYLDDIGFEQARQTGRSRQYEKEYIRKDGSRVPILIVIALNQIDGEEYFTCTILNFSEHKKIERELRESVQDFRALVEASSQVVWTISEQDGNKEFEEFWKNLTGQTDEEMSGSKWLNAVHPEDREKTRQLWRDTLKNQTQINGAYRVLTVDGEYRYFAVRGIPVLNEHGELRKWLGTFIDITERMQFEKDLQESEERLTLSQKAGRVGTFEWNFKTDKIIFSDTLWSIYGLDPSEGPFTYDLFKEFAHPDDLEYVERGLAAALDETDTINLEFRIIKKDNQTVWLSSKARVYRDESGTPERMVGINIDITERKLVEEELRQSEARFVLAQEGAKMGTAEWNLVTNQSIWSDGLWAQLGLEPGAIESNYPNYMDFILPEDRADLERHFNDAIANHTPVDTEYRMRRNDGEILWIAAKGAVIYDKEGNPERMVGMTIDITDRRKAEENLQISEEKLRQAQKLESIGRLAGGIAHDFNNMLTAINGYSDLLLQQMQIEDPHRRFVEEIRKSGGRSAALTQQLLAFSRRQILQPKILNLNKVVSDTTVMLQRLIGEDVRLIEKFGSEDGLVKADPGQITQVIMNLAVNARDAMPNGGTLTIETENIYIDDSYIEKNPGLQEGEYVLLKVSDTGIGIGEDILENIFEPFFTTKEIGVGTGLGLATVYGIIKQSNGHISVRSEKDSGAIFEIYLPRIENHDELPQSYEEIKDVLSGSEKILVVEDEDAVRNLTCEILQSYGYDIVTANNGEHALKICQSGKYHFDLLLTDVIMPKMGGRELAANLSQKFPQMAVLFTSGYSEDAQLEIESGYDIGDFIHKPFTPDSLAQKVREVLDKNVAPDF